MAGEDRNIAMEALDRVKVAYQTMNDVIKDGTGECEVMSYEEHALIDAQLHTLTYSEHLLGLCTRS
ncbi:hypothetical protein PYCCODRAFT_1469464 [Trametes coccinea BRFM310]|uniref:Uncharacterized protein n=1 Tax=Trametes coccinea (strain BRFM310) TaxID=1353009 RepID=A0A1Y2IGQ9_TRAC3|nr:hypothetical protein PYCCODRAFT_1469464 [Trametes coccinea BRFM310]